MADTIAPTMPSGVSIGPLLKKLRPPSPRASAEEIALAISNIFTNQISETQMALLLYILSITELEQDPDVLAKCALAMRMAANPIRTEELRTVIDRKNLRWANYNGGLCDIVGTGGDHHSTFNISTTSSIICSSLLAIAKHGNRASTSKSGSADVLAAMLAPNSPKIDAINPDSLLRAYQKSNYAFLFAPTFHTGARYAASIRKQIPHPTIFNLLGPLANPLEDLLEARVVGVKNNNLVPIFARALVLNKVRKALVVCGAEDLDEISCAGPTNCAWVSSNKHSVANGVNGHSSSSESSFEVDSGSIDYFQLSPSDFGLPAHPLNSVSPGLTPSENAEILTRILSGQMSEDDPILHFVLMNAAALFVVSGVCQGNKCPFGKDEEIVKTLGPGGGRWKEGVRLAKLAISSRTALTMFEKYADATNSF